MNQRLRWFAACLVVAVLSLGACSRPGATPPAGQATEALPSGGIVVTDSQGRTVDFAVPPQRIVVAGKSTLPLLDAMYLFPEARERVVGWVTGRQKPEAFLRFLDPAHAAKAALAVEAGPEQVTALQPDVVILRSLMADTLGRALEQLAIPVVYLDMETPAQHAQGLQILGQLLANPARARALQAYYQSRLDQIAQALQGLPPAERPRILILQYTVSGGAVALQVPPASYIQTTMAELAGAVPVWKEAAVGGGWQVVNLEQIFAWNPDQIYIISYDTDSAQVAAQLRGDPQWQGLQAVRAGRVYGFAGDIFSWDQPDPRWILGQLWLAQRVHPERLRTVDIRQEVSRFFGEMYGLDAASIERDIMPQLKGDLP